MKYVSAFILILFFGLHPAKIFAQTETGFYSSFFTDELLQNMLNEEKDNFIKYLENVDEIQISKLTTINVVNSNNVKLIKSIFSNNKRNVEISNSFLRVLAKITDAFFIEIFINKGKATDEYIKYCAENLNETPIGPTTYFKLSQVEIGTYINGNNSRVRTGFFILALRFILSHEMFHQIYHLDNAHPSKLDKVEQELQADRLAMGYVESAGFPPLILTHIMQYMDDLSDPGKTTSYEFTHPGGAERKIALVNSSLNSLPEVYNKLTTLAPPNMRLSDFRTKIFDLGIDFYSEFMKSMDQDRDTYLQLANDGNTNAQIKMGVMYFRGTEGWDVDEQQGFHWLEKASAKSDFAGLFLGMFYEYKGEIDKAIAAYYNSALKGNYYALTMREPLLKWKSQNRQGFKSLMALHVKDAYNRCMISCQDEFKYSKENCEIHFCKETFLNMFSYLQRFRKKYAM